MPDLFIALKWSIKLAAWATPAIRRAWSMERSLNRIEGERALKSRNYADAEKYLTDAVAEADLRRHSVRKVQFRLELAEAQRKQAKLDEAESTVRAALEHTARISNPSGYVQCVDALAEVFHDRGDFASMEAALQEGVRIEAAMPHPDPLRMARRIHRLGIARHKSGRTEDAIPALEKALKLHEETVGPDDPATGDVLGELGPMYRAHSRHELAQSCLRRALKIHERHLGWDSAQAMSDLHHLAGSLEETGDLDGAAALYERVLSLKLRVVGGSLEELAEMQFGLAGIYIGWSNYARARELLAESIGTFKRRKDARLAIAYETIAHVEEFSGRYPEALVELAHAAKIWESLGDGRRRELVENLEHRADLLDQLRRKSEAAWLRGKIGELNGAAPA